MSSGRKWSSQIKSSSPESCLCVSLRAASQTWAQPPELLQVSWTWSPHMRHCRGNCTTPQHSDFMTYTKVLTLFQLLFHLPAAARPQNQLILFMDNNLSAFNEAMQHFNFTPGTGTYQAWGLMFHLFLILQTSKVSILPPGLSLSCDSFRVSNESNHVSHWSNSFRSLRDELIWVLQQQNKGARRLMEQESMLCDCSVQWSWEQNWCGCSF